MSETQVEMSRAQEGAAGGSVPPLAWQPLLIGGLPHLQPLEAWEAILRYCPRTPAWPRLPRRSRLENMYLQFSERFPGLTLNDERMYVNRRSGLSRGLELLYLAYLEGDYSHGRIGASYAAALAMLQAGQVQLPENILALKGEVVGPVSWGLTLVDQNRRPVLYDEILEDAVAKHLRLKAAWQERILSQLAPQTIVLVNEPYMASYGSSSISVSRSKVIALFEEVFGGLSGLKALHCCGRTDWSVLLDTSVDLISFDAYDYAGSLSAHVDALKRFLKRGGIIVWGIVPASEAALEETASQLTDRLCRQIDVLQATGISQKALWSQGMVSPSCSLEALTPQLAERILHLTAQVAEKMRARSADVLSESSSSRKEA